MVTAIRRRSQVSLQERQLIIQQHRAGVAIGALARNFGRVKKTIQRVLEEGTEYARPTVLRSIRDEGDRQLKDWVLRDATISTKDLVERYNRTFEPQISEYMVRPYLEGFHYTFVIAPGSPPLPVEQSEITNYFLNYADHKVAGDNRRGFHVGFSVFTFSYRNNSIADRGGVGRHPTFRQSLTIYVSIEGPKHHMVQIVDKGYRDEDYRRFLGKVRASHPNNLMYLRDRAEHSLETREFIHSLPGIVMIPSPKKECDAAFQVLLGIPERVRTQTVGVSQDVWNALNNNLIVFGNFQETLNTFMRTASVLEDRVNL